MSEGKRERGTDMKYDHAFEMFNDMMNFALAHGMIAYQSDMMHDAVELSNAETLGDAVEFLWIVKSNGYGTWLWDRKHDIPNIVTNDTGAKAIIKYDGHSWTFDRQ